MLGERNVIAFFEDLLGARTRFRVFAAGPHGFSDAPQSLCAGKGTVRIALRTQQSAGVDPHPSSSNRWTDGTVSSMLTRCPGGECHRPCSRLQMVDVLFRRFFSLTLAFPRATDHVF